MQKLTPMPLDTWLDTKTTLHLYTQIIGKIRLACHPAKNHWWHVTLYLTARGLTTGPIPYQGSLFQIDLDFIDHQLIVSKNDSQQSAFALPGLSVQQFYHNLLDMLHAMSIYVDINTNPFDPNKVGSDIPFDLDHEHGTYDTLAVEQFWQILCAIYPIMQQFSGQFFGKCTPLHFYWHSFDYVLTFFSGKHAPLNPEMDNVAKNAYSHEVISFGFWPGDDSLPEPAFYSYAFPEPENIAKQHLAESAAWVDVGTGLLAIYKYSDWINSDDKHRALLAFLNSAYYAGARLMHWDDQLMP
ncbi:MAG: hypothetical protein KDH94_04365 [Coxiellaceae bacterium]|nr:hypothetical protein [Coxiellaceae bacterium]